MSESVKERVTADLQKAKSEGKIRAERIQEIVQDAFSQALSEVKEGSGEIRVIAKETLSEMFKRISETRQKREITADQADSTSPESMIQIISKGIRSRLFATLHQTYTGLPDQYTQLKERAVNLDANLTERYGDRYGATKQRIKDATVWYNTVKTQAEASSMEPTVLQQRQEAVEIKLGEAGTTLAQKERQVKQQLKQFVKTAAAKL